MNKQVILAVKKYEQLLKKAHVQFDSLIVFGSQAKGHDRYTERVALMKLSTDDTIDIEPHPYHPDDLANPWDSLAVEIRKYGVNAR